MHCKLYGKRMNIFMRLILVFYIKFSFKSLYSVNRSACYTIEPSTSVGFFYFFIFFLETAKKMLVTGFKQRVTHTASRFGVDTSNAC